MSQRVIVVIYRHDLLHILKAFMRDLISHIISHEQKWSLHFCLSKSLMAVMLSDCTARLTVVQKHACPPWPSWLKHHQFVFASIHFLLLLGCTNLGAHEFHNIQQSYNYSEQLCLCTHRSGSATRFSCEAESADRWEGGQTGRRAAEILDRGAQVGVQAKTSVCRQ